MKERSLLDYWVILSRRRYVIYVVLVSAVLAAIVVGRLVPPVYEARAALYIPVDLPTVSYLSGQTSSLARTPGTPIQKEDQYMPYIGILKSVRLAELVHSRFPQKDVAKLLRSDVDFEVTDEYIVRVYSRDPDPEVAASIANAYVEGLNQILAEGSQAQVKREPDFIKSAMAQLQAELMSAEDILKRFEKQHSIASLDKEMAELTGQKLSLLSRLDDAAVSIAANRTRQKALTDELEQEGLRNASSTVATSSPLIEHLRVQLSDLVARISELEGELGKKNVEIIALRKRKTDMEQQLREEVDRWLSSSIKPQNSQVELLRKQLIDVVVEGKTLEATRAGLQRSLAGVEQRMRTYPEIKAEWTNLNDAVTRLRTSQQQLRSSMLEARMQTDREMSLVVHLDRAVPPTRPSFPIWWLNGLVALLGGLLAGICYSFFLNYLEETRQLRTSRLVQAILRQPSQAVRS